MSKHPQIERRELIARTRLFHIEQLDIVFGNGRQVSYERLVTGGLGAVLAVPMLDANTALLIREYSAGTDRYELALPKGRMEPGETPEQAANREMTEEIGYAARRLTPLTRLSLAPAYMAHAIHLVLAEDLYPERAQGDEPEPLEVVPWPLDQLLELSLREDCSEARSIAALYMVRDYLNQRETG
ncbi:MAG: ADP compounds hydrolase NudE [Thiotrichales bacterium]